MKKNAIHYGFLLILSLFLLLLGISFCNFSNSKTKQNSDAAYIILTVSYKAYWINPVIDGELTNINQFHTGNYQTGAGYGLSKSVGEVNFANTPGGNHGTWSTPSVNTTLDDDMSQIVFTSVTDNSFSGGVTAQWWCTFYPVAKSGFQILYETNREISGGKKLGMWQQNEPNAGDLYIVVFSPKTYTITYYSNGGIFSDGATSKSNTTQFYEDYTAPSSTPTRTGYTFSNWKGNKGTIIGSSYYYMDDVDQTSFYAQWTANEYNITFDKQGGSYGDSKATATYDSTVPKITVPNKIGYKFLGYYTGTNGSGTRYYDEAGNGLVTYTQTSAITLYAKWQKETYKLKFNANGGSCSTTQATVTYGQTYTFPTPTRIGYSFDGWQYGSSTYYKNSTTIPDFGSDGSTVNLTAKWTLEEYDIVYYPNNSLDSWSDNVHYGEIYTLHTPLKKPTQLSKLGYRFTNWKYTGSVSAYYGVTYGQPPDDYEITIPDWGDSGEDVPLQAQWIPNEYDIIFDGNDSTSGEMSSQHMIYDRSATLYKNNFQRTGYEFRGWSTVKMVGSDYVEGDEMYIDQQSVVNLTSVHNAEITLYAVWDPIEYTLRYNANNGTSDFVDETFTYDIPYTLKNNEFIYHGYLFTGWATSTNGSVTYYNEVEVKNLTNIKDAVVNIYAIWKETWALHNQKPSGRGTITDPYLIANAQNLAWLSWKYEEGTSFDNGTITPVCIQTANIDLIEYEWLPIGNQSKPFTGNYDGNGYIIKNVRTFRITNVIRENIGLFGYASQNPTSSTSNYIKNVRIWGDIKGNSNVGGILGYGNSVTIENCTNNSTISATTITDSATSIAGGIAGQIQNAEIISCYNYGDISSSTNDGVSGGIVGQGDLSKILNSYSNCNLDNGYYSGGIAGKMTAGEISSSVFEGTVYGSYSGAISGFLSNVTITNCFVKGQTENKSNKGLYAQSSNTVKFLNCIIEIFKIIEGIETIDKGYTGTDFSNWIISSDGRPLPSGLSWLAIGGTKVTDISQISANYTKF